MLLINQWSYFKNNERYIQIKIDLLLVSSLLNTHIHTHTHTHTQKVILTMILHKKDKYVQS